MGFPGKRKDGTINPRPAPLLVATGEHALEDHKVKDYLLGRLGRLFHWQEMDGPNGRSAEYWESEDTPWWM